MDFVWKGFLVVIAVLLMNASSFEASAEESGKGQFSIDELFPETNEDYERIHRRKRFYIQEISDDQNTEEDQQRMSDKLKEPPGIREVNSPWYVHDLQYKKRPKLPGESREILNSNQNYHDY